MQLKENTEIYIQEDRNGNSNDMPYDNIKRRSSVNIQYIMVNILKIKIRHTVNIQ